MCLERIYDRPWFFCNEDLRIKDKEYFGYKVFRKFYDEHPDCEYTTEMGFTVKYNQWILNPDSVGIYCTELKSSNNKIYKSGFHIFLLEKDARKYAEEYYGEEAKVKKVKFKNVTCFGTQIIRDGFLSYINHHVPVVVAQEIYLEG
jgi:hypothetical protein